MSAPHPFLPFRLGCHFALSRNRPRKAIADTDIARGGQDRAITRGQRDQGFDIIPSETHRRLLTRAVDRISSVKPAFFENVHPASRIVHEPDRPCIRRHRIDMMDESKMGKPHSGGDVLHEIVQSIGAFRGADRIAE